MLVEGGAEDEDPNAETGAVEPKALVPDAGEVVSFDAPDGAPWEAAPSLLDARPKLVEPKAEGGFPLLAALLKAPKPKPLEGLEAAPKAGDGVDAFEMDPNADEVPNAGEADVPKAGLEPKADD